MRGRLAHGLFASSLTLVAVSAVVWPPGSLAASAPLQRVYECRDGATRVLSDRPCGPDASSRALDPQRLNRYTPMPVPNSAPSSTVAVRPVLPGRTPVPRQRSCEDLQLEIDRIDSRMRLGYTGKVGEKLRAQRRRLTDQYATRRCNTTSRRPQK